MSARLGAALAEYLRRHLVPGQRQLRPRRRRARRRCRRHEPGLGRLPATLAIVSPEPHRFGRHALTDVSGTQLRNQPGTAGVVLVLCDGEQVPDRQSLNLFESVSPSVLLDSAEGMGILSQQQPPVDLDGPARAVREAIIQADAANRPSAVAVAAYLDQLAGGADPLRALPAIGAFTDHVADGERVDSGRVSDNLALAARRTSEDLLKPTAYADLRKRAERVLAQRPGLRTGLIAAAADDVMASSRPAAPTCCPACASTKPARSSSSDPRRSVPSSAGRSTSSGPACCPAAKPAMLPWNIYEKRADDLGRGAMQRAAAQELCDLDDAQQRQVFTKPTRNKLERLLRDKSVNGSNPSCPEAAIVRAAQQLGGLIERVQVLEPNRRRPTLPLPLIAPAPAASSPSPAPACASAG